MSCIKTLFRSSNVRPIYILHSGEVLQYKSNNMITNLVQANMGELLPSITTATVFGLLMCLGLLTITSKSEGPLPGIPRLKGYPILGAIPIYFRDGMALMLETLTTLGTDGIAYAQIGNKTLVSVHDPVMAKEVLAFTDKIASRYAFSSCRALYIYR
jgi:hypothetical protein